MPAFSRRAALRIGTVVTAAGAIALVGAAPAFAHVTAQGTAQQGGYSVITFRVPDEDDAAGTTALTVTLPTDHPISSVRTTPIAGWTATTSTVALNPPVQDGGRTITKTVGSITWTAAAGSRIAPGQYLDFPVSLGPLPDVPEITFTAKQTYDNGTVVDWNQPRAADGSEPEHPAPSITLTPAAAGTDAHGMTMASGAAAPEAGGTDTTARWLGGAGLLVGALGLGVGGGAVLRTRRGGPPRVGRDT
jgi:periplasmic copper chaperone A